MIENEVRRLSTTLYNGERLSVAERKMIVYGKYGNPSDAYKYFEYNYQEEYLPHRYLPEHVVLHELPKSSGYCMPVPRQLANPGEGCHEDVRGPMLHHSLSTPGAY